MPDAYRNLAISQIVVPPDPPLSGTTLTIRSGDTFGFPDPPFNCTVWPPGTLPDYYNAEIIRVTSSAGPVFTIVRAHEGTQPQSLLVNSLIANTVTKELLDQLHGTVGPAGPPGANGAAGPAGPTGPAGPSGASAGPGIAFLGGSRTTTRTGPGPIAEATPIYLDGGTVGRTGTVYGEATIYPPGGVCQIGLARWTGSVWATPTEYTGVLTFSASPGTFQEWSFPVTVATLIPGRQKYRLEIFTGAGIVSAVIGYVEMI